MEIQFRIRTAKIRKYSQAVFLLFSTALLSITFAQSQSLSQEEFNQGIIKAYNNNRSTIADSLIKNNRLLVKPFVNSLITGCIESELKGKVKDASNLQAIASRAAESFEKIFSEKSLTIGVNYLTVWTIEQKKKKIVADSSYAVGTKLRIAKESTKALQELKHALDLYSEIKDERGEAEVLGGIGAVNFDVKDAQNAMSFYNEALVQRKKVDDRQLIGSTLNGLGSVNLIFLNDYQKALQFYDKAEKIRNEIGDLAGLRTTKSYEADAYFDWGELQTLKGNYTDALEKYNKALEIRTELDKRSEVGEVLSHIGFVYSRVGDYGEAVSKLTEAKKIAKEENDSLGLAGVFNNLGVSLQNAGRIEKSLDYYNNSLEIYQKFGKPDMTLPILSNLGTIYFDRKEYEKAEDYQERGLQLSHNLGEKDLEVNFLLNLANDQIMLGKIDSARSNYDSAYEIARSFNSPELIWKIFAGMAETHERKGEYDKVIQLNDSALKIIGNMRNNLQSSELRASYLASERYAFEGIINMLEMLHEKDGSRGYDTLAFRYAEQCKSRVLLDLLTESMSNKEKKENYNEKTRNEFLQNAQPVSLKEVQAICPAKNTVILEYMVGDSSSCLWAITKTNHQLFRLPDRKKLQEQVETIRFAMLDPSQPVNEFFTEAGNSLYEELIKPAESFFTKKSELIIIPDGVLNYLPFEVLLTEKKTIRNSATFSDMPFLVEKYPVSYAQSASVLKSLLSESIKKTNELQKKERFIAFADPEYNNSTEIHGEKFKRLEYSSGEVENIASFFDKGASEIFLGKDATEENVKKENRFSGYNYIHFATHGLIDENNPDLSSLVLTRDDHSTEDGMLTASEIFNLKLNANLVVLSACQTGLGKLVRGEGMVGLTRAFMYAGTPSVLVSLWSVSDNSTSVLMGEFYKNLIRNRLSKTDALRKAQLTLLSDKKLAHPFYWAPFVLIGDWR